jgi:hypothetical protein
VTDSKHKASIVIGGSLSSTLGAAFGGAEKMTKRLGATVAAVNKQQKALAAGGVKALRENGAALRKLGVDTNDLGKAQAQLAARSDQLGRQLAALRGAGKLGTFSQIGGALWRGAAALTAAVGASHGLSFAALFHLSKSTADSAKELKEAADYLGMAPKSLKELRYVASRHGVEERALTVGLEKLTARMSQASFGTGEAAEALRRLHLSARQLQAVGTEEAVFMLSDALAEVETDGERAELAIKIFGESGIKLVNMFKGGAPALMRMRQELYKTGATAPTRDQLDRSEAFVRAWIDMGESIEEVRKTVGLGLMPVFTDLMRRFGGFLQGQMPTFARWASEWATWAGKTLPSVVAFLRDDLTPALKTTWGAIGGTAEAMGGWGNVAKIAGGILAVWGIAKFAIFAAEVVTATKALWALTAAFGGPAIGAAVGGLRWLTGAFLSLTAATAGWVFYIGGNVMGAAIGGMMTAITGIGTAVAGVTLAFVGWAAAIASVVAGLGLMLYYRKEIADWLGPKVDKASDAVLGVEARLNAEAGMAGSKTSSLNPAGPWSRGRAPESLIPKPIPLNLGGERRTSFMDAVRAMDDRTPRAFAGVPVSAGGQTVHQSVTVNVQGAPGQSPMAIVDEIERRLRSKSKQDARSVLFDTGGR